MEKSKAGIDIMKLLAQWSAKINALEDPKVIKSELDIKMPSSAECQDTASIVYHYLQQVCPTISSTLLGVSKCKDKAKKKLNPTKNPIASGSRINDISTTKISQEIFKNSQVDINTSVAQSVVQFEAMEARNVKMKTLETKMSSTFAICPDTVSIVYNYLKGVNSTIASLLLEIHPEVVDFPCNITLEEVVLLHWANQTCGKRDDRVSTLKVEVKETVGINKNPIVGRKGKRKVNEINTDHGKVIIKEGYDKSVSKADNENVGSIKDVNDSVKARRTQSRSVLKAKRAFTPREDDIILNKVEEMGDDLNIGELAVGIGRSYGAVTKRIKKLKSGEAGN